MIKGKSLLLCFFLCIAALSSKAQTIVSDTTISTNFINRLSTVPIEKLYVHTDRDTYTAGDTIWFRAYLVNASTLRICDFSRFVYAELKDKSDSTHNRVKIKMTDDGFAGFMPIPDKIQQGDYMFRAFTTWMENDGEDFLFKKRIRIVNPFDSRVFTKISYQNSEGKKYAKITFLNNRNEPFSREDILYQYGELQKNSRFRIARTSQDGNIMVRIDSAKNVDRLYVKFSDNGPFDFSRDLWLPLDTLGFNVQFFPEGGALLAGTIQNIAFKALGSDGMSVDVEGEIYNSKGEVQYSIASLHAGMGTFSLTVNPEESYYAMIKLADGGEKTRFNLPEVSKTGVAISLMRKYDKDLIYYKINLAQGEPLPQNLTLFVHSRGIPIISQKINNTNIEGALSTKDFPEGISHICLLDGQCNVLSDRLFFIRNTEQPKLAVNTNKQRYAVREPVTLTMNLAQNIDTSWSGGSFSISVVNKSLSERDSIGCTILSTLLLTSDLKGYVEDPEFYFRTNDTKSERLLDNLLMTQGWSRFDVSKVARGEELKYNYYLERGQAISGQIVKYSGKAANDSKLIALTSTGQTQMVDADRDGKFIIDQIPFVDSTLFIVQGISAKGRKFVEVQLDKDKFLPSTYNFPRGVRQQAEDENFFARNKQEWYIDEYGMRVYVLDEVVIRRSYRKNYHNFYEATADQMLDSARIAEIKYLNLEQIITKLPGVYLDRSNECIKCFNRELLIYLDNFELDQAFFHELVNMRGDEILSIVYISPTKGWSIFGPKGINGAIVITRNPDFVPPSKRLPSLVTFHPFGYQEPEEFYVPAYQIDSTRLALKDVPDDRKTIYWNPFVNIDANGKADVNFTTSDGYGKYSIVIEGITKHGEPIHVESEMGVGTL